jgi:predicted alpha/beta-hydrolase family hydrolase
LIAVGYPTRWPDLEELYACRREKIFIQSTRDEFGPQDQLNALVAELPEPKSLFWVEAADHFFADALDAFEGLVEELVWEDPLLHDHA